MERKAVRERRRAEREAKASRKAERAASRAAAGRAYAEQRREVERAVERCYQQVVERHRAQAARRAEARGPGAAERDALRARTTGCAPCLLCCPFLTPRLLARLSRRIGENPRLCPRAAGGPTPPPLESLPCARAASPPYRVLVLPARTSVV